MQVPIANQSAQGAVLMSGVRVRRDASDFGHNFTLSASLTMHGASKAAAIIAQDMRPIYILKRPQPNAAPPVAPPQNCTELGWRVATSRLGSVGSVSGVCGSSVVGHTSLAEDGCYRDTFDWMSAYKICKFS